MFTKISYFLIILRNSNFPKFKFPFKSDPMNEFITNHNIGDTWVLAWKFCKICIRKNLKKLWQYLIFNFENRFMKFCEYWAELRAQSENAVTPLDNFKTSFTNNQSNTSNFRQVTQTQYPQTDIFIVMNTSSIILSVKTIHNWCNHTSVSQLLKFCKALKIWYNFFIFMYIQSILS